MHLIGTTMPPSNRYIQSMALSKIYLYGEDWLLDPR
jgi:hypothetical protein